MNTLETRLLKAADIFNVCELDDKSGFEVARWIDDDNDWAYGLFEKGILIGYCTIGYADDCCSAIENHRLYNSDSLLLDNVFILPEHRHTNKAIRMISDAVTLRWKYDGIKSTVFLSSVCNAVSSFYELIGFKTIEDSNCMVLCP